MGRFAYLLLAGVTLMTGTFSMVINKSRAYSNNTSIEHHIRSEVRNIANNYAMIAMKKLKENTNADDFSTNNVGNTSADVDVTYENWDDAGSSLDYGVIKINSEATINYMGKEYKWNVSVSERNVPFSNYLIFTNTMGYTNFIGTQYIGGPVHVNNTINLIRDHAGNDPTFVSKVTFNNSLFRYYNSSGYIRTGNIADFTGFQNGYESGVTIQGPDNFFFDTSNPHYNNYVGSNLSLFPEFNSYYNTDAQFKNNVDQLATEYTSTSNLHKNQNYDLNDTKYIKIDDESIFVSPVPPGFWRYDEVKKEIPISTIVADGGVFYTDGNVHVEGNLDGKVTIAAEKEIFIDGDLTYENYDESLDDPFENCQDILSLMTKEDLVISTATKYFDENRSPSWTDPNIEYNENGLSILSALYTQKGIHIQNWDEVKTVVGRRGNLNIIGSFVTNEYGATGLYSSGGTWGFSKQFHYDPRFGYYAPYGMPDTQINVSGVNKKQRQIIAWDESNSCEN